MISLANNAAALATDQLSVAQAEQQLEIDQAAIDAGRGPRHGGHRP